VRPPLHDAAVREVRMCREAVATAGELEFGL